MPMATVFARTVTNPASRCDDKSQPCGVEPSVVPGSEGYRDRAYRGGRCHHWTTRRPAAIRVRAAHIPRAAAVPTVVDRLYPTAGRPVARAYILCVLHPVANAASPFPHTGSTGSNFAFDALGTLSFYSVQRSTKKHVDAATHRGGEGYNQRKPIINGMSPHACNMRSCR